MSFTGHEEQPLGRSQFAPQRNRLRDERTDYSSAGSSWHKQPRYASEQRIAKAWQRYVDNPSWEELQRFKEVERAETTTHQKQPA